MAADSEFIRQAKGAVEICRMSADLAQDEVRAAERDHGFNSEQRSKAVSDGREAEKKCAAEAKANVLPAYKAQLKQTPELQALVSDAYTAWLTQMDHLGMSNQPTFDSAINRLQAELDVR